MNKEDKEKMRDELMFLRGMIEGMSFFSEDSNMGAALESAQNLFDVIADNVIELME